MNLTVQEKNILIEAIGIQLGDALKVLNLLTEGKYEQATIDVCKKKIDIYLTIINKIQNA